MRWGADIEKGAALYLYTGRTPSCAIPFCGRPSGAAPSVDLLNRIALQDWLHLMRSKTAASKSAFCSLTLSDKNLCNKKPVRKF